MSVCEALNVHAVLVAHPKLVEIRAPEVKMQDVLYISEVMGKLQTRPAGWLDRRQRLHAFNKAEATARVSTSWYRLQNRLAGQACRSSKKLVWEDGVGIICSLCLNKAADVWQ